jgi:hypothetical protein
MYTNTTTPQFLYSLKETAKKVGVDDRSILDAGAKGKIKLLIHLPDASSIHMLANKAVSDENLLVGTPLFGREPNMLCLSELTCFALLRDRGGRAVANKFPSGYVWYPRLGIDNGEAIRLAPLPLPEFQTPDTSNISDAWKKQFWVAWCLGLTKENKLIETTISDHDIFVTQTDIFLLKNIPLNVTGNVSDADLPNERIKLLEEAAQIFWLAGNVIQEEISSYPNTNEIIAWFQLQGFSKSLATSAATIIRPDFAKTGRRDK